MKEKTIKINNNNIHFIKTKRFKTIDIRIVFRNVFKREDITYRNFLLDILLYATKKYPSNRLLNIKCQELYSLYLGCSNFRLGNYLISKIDMSLLNPRYTENSMLDESINLLWEVIFNPLVDEDGFNKEFFEQIKIDLQSEIDTIKEQPRLYANIRLCECMEKNTPYTYHGYCYKEDLNSITPSSLYNYYKKFLQNNIIDIYIVGDINVKNLFKLFNEKFAFNNQDIPKKELFYIHKNYKSKEKIVIETGNYNQAKLAVGLKIKSLSEYETKYVSTIYNLLLGGISESLLMKNVREEYSLAYYAYSIIDKADNLIIINCGIDEKNYDKALLQIKKSLNDILIGNFDDKDIYKCVMEYLASLKLMQESTTGILDLALSTLLHNSDDLTTKELNIKKVNKQDIVNFSKKVCIDTVYMLKGE